LELEVECILHDYGEASNWQFLQKQILKAWEMGGLHSTGDLVKLINSKKSVPSQNIFLIQFEYSLLSAVSMFVTQVDCTICILLHDAF